ncbi:MAG TPA: hypothetical protein VK206_21735, partial [Anaerolineales bacterium]|nr:hypothetical protein [Anaerolineales bacterium]
MFAVKPWKEFAMRALLSSVILFNALTPIGVSISKAEGENESAGSINSNNDIKNGITLGNPLPQRAEKVPVLADQITKQAQGQQEEKPVRFKATAEPAIFTPGKPVNLRWQVQNMKTEDQQKAEVVIHAPEGLMPADPNPTYVQDGLITVPLQDKKDSSAWNVSEGAELPIYFELDLLVNDDFIASETVMVDQAHFSVEKNKGGKLKGLGGKVELDVPANVTDESLDLDIREPAPQSQPGTSLTWQPLEIIAVGQNSQKDIHQFKAPLKLTLRYDETQIFDWDENALTIYYYDPDVSDWFQIETSVDSKNNTLTAYTNHLTVFDYKANNWQSHMAPTVDDFKVADFTGAGTYAINLWTPPGPDGLQPNLTLSYNSQVIDDSTAFTQASWVGMGWDLDTGAVLHNLHGTDQDFSDDTFSISAGGVSGLLLPIGYDGNITTYNTADQSFLKVQGNDADYTFTAWGKNGTKYFFAQKDTSNVNVNNGCPTKTDVTWRWSLSSVTDIHANTITYTNENETKANCTANQIAVYPKTITYGKYQIVFETEARTDYQTSWTSPDSRTLYGTQRLHQVMIKENGVPIRSYVFSYAPDTAATNVIYPNFNWSNQDAKTLTLVGIQVFAGDGNDPSASALPAVTFTYVDGMHLTDVDNGQGGQVHIGY